MVEFLDGLPKSLYHYKEIPKKIKAPLLASRRVELTPSGRFPIVKIRSLRMTTKTQDRPFRGYIQVYTGHGKGKTTAALGQALRASGRQMRTYLGQFLKGSPSGEVIAARSLEPWITIEQFGREGFLHIDDTPGDEDVERARRGLAKCREAMRSGTYRLVILDEVCVALYFKLLAEKDVLEFLDEKPADVEVILTGRYAPASLIERADLVTDMREVKHYGEQGVRARDGVER
jgi:cob(I)alamin adenosyltransferase